MDHQTMKLVVNNYDGHVSIMVIENEMCIATAGMDFMTDSWWLARVMVKHPHRKKGIGRRMVALLKENNNGYPIIVYPGGYDLTKEEQFAFYEQCGFVRKTEHSLELPV